MKKRICRGVLCLSLFVPFQPAHAAEVKTCSCAADYKVYHSGISWTDLLCVFPSSGSGPYNECKRATWKHTFGTRLVKDSSIFWSGWDTLQEIAEGDEKSECETADSDFQKIAYARLVKVCSKDGGTDCSKIKISCRYKSVTE